MYFIMGLLQTIRPHDLIWVIVNRLAKSTHFIPVRVDYRSMQLANIYTKEIMRLYEVSISIISDRGTQFASIFLNKLHEELGVDFSIAFHPQIDMQLERTIKVLQDILRS